LKYGAAGATSGSHTVTGTVVDAVGLLAESGKLCFNGSGIGLGGSVSPNVDPAKRDFDTAGNADDPINVKR
jgi:hypothetical protein